MNRQLQGLLTEQQGFQSSSSSNGNGSRESRERERESGRSRDSGPTESRQDQYRTSPPSSSSTSSSSSSSSSYSSRDYFTRSEKDLKNSRTVDDELMKLKKKMGLK